MAEELQTLASQFLAHLRSLNTIGVPLPRPAAIETANHSIEEHVHNVQQVIPATSNAEPVLLFSTSQEWHQQARTMSLEELSCAASACARCRLAEGRKNVVFGVGNTDSPLIAFVGEGPGAEEDLKGEPFVGKAGQLLTAAIEKGLGLTRNDVYICNVVKCRPPGNRTPLPDEVEQCSPYLFRQLSLIRPKAIITLGQAAQLALVGRRDGITKIRGTWLEWEGVRVMPTFHPAYLLRNPGAKRLFWDDLKLVMAYVGL